MQLEGNWSDVTDIGYCQYHIGDLVSRQRMVGPNPADLMWIPGLFVRLHEVYWCLL